MSTCAGTIDIQASGGAWLEVSQGRYMPAAEETVVGIVVETHSEAYAVDIGAPLRATLPVLSFEGASKHNRPKLTVGSLVHARILTSSDAKEPILTCVDEAGHAGGLGVLAGGRGLHSSTSQLNVSNFCGIRWVPQYLQYISYVGHTVITRHELGTQRLTDQNGLG